MKKIIALIFLLPVFFLNAGAVQKPMAVYMKNLPQERVGEWTDAQIKADLEAKGFVVVEHDCSSYPRDAFGLVDALMEFWTGFGATLSDYETADVTIDSKSVFFVPEGYTVTSDIPIWNLATHGAEGTLKKIVNSWNNYIVKDFGVDPVTSVDEMYDKHGNPVSLDLCMDIIHPSGKASKSVPLLLNFSSSAKRMSTFRPESERGMMPICFMTSGYAFASVDHCFNPLAKDYIWKFYSWYSFEDQNGLFSSQAYIRYVRTHLEDYNLNGKIGVMGISKASYAAMRMADPDNASTAEHSMFNSTPNTKPQPWPDGGSHVDVAYTSAGHGITRIQQYFDSDCVPLLTACGKTDQYNAWVKYPPAVKYLNDIDHLHYAFWMEELGHTIPVRGIDFATGERRPALFKRFFDHFLKPSDETKADVFCIFPKEGAGKVDAYGMSRMLPADNLLPVDMLGIPTETPIAVRFLEEFTVDAVSEAVTVTEVETGTPVEGEWEVSFRNTCFSFMPSSPLKKGKTYRITVPVSLTSVSGARPSVEYTRDFKVTEAPDAPVSIKTDRIFPTDDTHTVFKGGTKINGTNETFKVRAQDWSKGRYVGFLKFDLTEINPVRMSKATVNLTLSKAVTAAVKVNFHKTGTEWEEETLNSDSKPDIESDHFDQVTVTPETSWIEVDATDVVKNCLDNGETCFSMAIWIPNGENEDVYMYPYTKEAETEETRPYMFVERSLPSSPTIYVDRELVAGTEVKLIVTADYEDKIESVTWYVDDVQSQTDVVTLSAGEHKLKAVVKGPEEIGTDVIVKYVEVR